MYPRSGRVSMKDVADRAGVSASTVSLVLSGKHSAIPEATRQRVLDAAGELGYRRNALAAGLRRQVSDTIGFISDLIATTPHAGAMVQGAQDAAWEVGKVLLMINTGGDPAVEHRAIEAMLARQVDGLVYAAMYHRLIDPPPALREVPAVLLDARSADPSLSSVAPTRRVGPSRPRRPSSMPATGGSATCRATPRSRRQASVSRATGGLSRPGGSRSTRRSSSQGSTSTRAGSRRRPSSWGGRIARARSSASTTAWRPAPFTRRIASGCRSPGTCRSWGSTTRSSWHPSSSPH